MNVNNPSVYPGQALPVIRRVENEPSRRMKSMVGTPAGLVLRLCQFGFAIASLCVMASTKDFISVFAFRYHVAAVSLQSLWSVSFAVVDIYAILVGLSLPNLRILSFFTIGDGLTSALTFSAASASTGIIYLLSHDLDKCAKNHCTKFTVATTMAFISWFEVTPSFLSNFWSLVSRVKENQEQNVLRI